MATFKAVPLEMITAPNYFSALPNNRWSVTPGNGGTFWFQLQISDNLGDRRYIPAVGAALEVNFQRADSVSMQWNYNSTSTINGLTPQLSTTPQSVVKAVTFNGSDRSLASIVLTPADSLGVVSGTILFKLTENGVPTTWIQNWLLVVNKTSPGM